MLFMSLLAMSVTSKDGFVGEDVDTLGVGLGDCEPSL